MTKLHYTWLYIAGVGTSMLREETLLVICRGGVHTHTIREETLRIICCGCGVTPSSSRGSIISLHAAHRACDHTYAILKLL